MFLKSKHNTDLSDAELVLQYKKKKDPEILGYLYSRYVTLVFGLCLKYLQDRDQSKDMVMHIFERLVLDLNQHDIRIFKSWLYVFSKNHCLMELRKQSTLKRREQSWLESHGEFMESQEQMHPIDDDEKAHLNGALQDCMRRLKQEQQLCVRLFYYENKSYREITELADLDERKVKSLLQNGKRNLKICLEKKHVR